MRLTTDRGDTLTQLDERTIDIAPDAIVLLSCVRNEVLRLPHFLDYHRALGVGPILVIDNDSDDGTTDHLLAQPDVHVFHTADGYADSRHGIDWINALARRFAIDHWVLNLDADELLVYPGCEDHDLRTLTGRLDRRRRTGLLTFMIDMYDDAPVADTVYEPGTPFVDRCPYFDTDTYRFSWRWFRRRVPAWGGARERLFWHAGDEPNSPLLPKIPLVRFGRRTAYTSSTHDVTGVRLASTTGALLHFKMFSDFAPRVHDEVERGEHWDDAAQYRSYSRHMAAHPDLVPSYPGSARYRDSGQLVDLGLIRP